MLTERTHVKAALAVGGFTTFSAFGLEPVYLLRRHEAQWALANVLVSVVAGLAAVWMGWRTVELLPR